MMGEPPGRPPANSPTAYRLTKDTSMHILASLSMVATLSLLAGRSEAQQNVGINLFRGSVTLSGVLCGFNCNSSGNTGQASALINDTIGIRLLGQDQFPAAVMIGAGAAAACPGLNVPGVGNALLVDPSTLLVLAATGALTGAARSSCGETANQILFTITLPRVPPGSLVHFQGVVFDGGSPAFTRPIELTIS